MSPIALIPILPDTLLEPADPRWFAVREHADSAAAAAQAGARLHAAA